MAVNEKNVARVHASKRNQLRYSDFISDSYPTVVKVMEGWRLTVTTPKSSLLKFRKFLYEFYYTQPS